jgi:hypothetical protein
VQWSGPTFEPYLGQDSAKMQSLVKGICTTVFDSGICNTRVVVNPHYCAPRGVVENKAFGPVAGC